MLEAETNMAYRFCKTDTRYAMIGIGASPGLQSASSAWVVVSSGPCPCSTFINMPWTNAQRQPAGLQKRCVHSSSTARVFHSTIRTGTKMSSRVRPPARELDPLLALLVEWWERASLENQISLKFGKEYNWFKIPNLFEVLVHIKICPVIPRSHEPVGIEKKI